MAEEAPPPPPPAEGEAEVEPPPFKPPCLDLTDYTIKADYFEVNGYTNKMLIHAKTKD